MSKRRERQLEVTETRMIRLPREWKGMARLGMSTSEGKCELKVRTQGMYIYLSDMDIQTLNNDNEKNYIRLKYPVQKVTISNSKVVDPL